MDNEAIKELESIIFDAKEKSGTAAEAMSGILGVLIDLKPVTATSFSIDEFMRFQQDELVQLLNSLGLKILFFSGKWFNKDHYEWVEYAYISKDMVLARRAHEAFERLWGTMDEIGQIFDPETWIDATEQIGGLLGYPKTAIDYYINSTNNDDIKERAERVRRNRYYAHSAEFEEQEYQTYDLRLNQAITEFAPKTAAYFSSEEDER